MKELKFYAIVSNRGVVYDVATDEDSAARLAHYRNEEFADTGVKWAVIVVRAQFTPELVKIIEQWGGEGA